MAFDEDFPDGEYVEEGTTSVTWGIRKFHQGEGVVFDWIVDTVGGGYLESDEYYDSAEDAKGYLGIA